MHQVAGMTHHALEDGSLGRTGRKEEYMPLYALLFTGRERY